MTYEEYKMKMQALLSKSFKYKSDQAGSAIYCEKMADLADQYPDYDAMMDNE